MPEKLKFHTLIVDKIKLTNPGLNRFKILLYGDRSAKPDLEIHLIGRGNGVKIEGLIEGLRKC